MALGASTPAATPLRVAGLPVRWTAGTDAAVADGPASLLLAAMYVLTVVGFPFFSTIPSILRLDSQIATVPYRALVLGLSLAVLYGWWVRGTRVCFNAAVLATLALWVMLLARMLHDTVVDPLPGELGIPVSQFILLSVGGCFLPALVFLQLPSERTLDVARVWIEVLGAIAMLGILYAGLRGVFMGNVLYRLMTPVLNPISVGHLGVSVLMVTLCGLAGSSGWARMLRIALAALCVVVIVAPVSRGPIAAGIIGALLVAFYLRGRRRVGPGGMLLRLVLLVAAVAGVVQAVVYLEENGYIDFAARLSDTLQDVAAQERAAMILGAWRQFTEHPLLGSAFVELRFMMNPHNILLESLMAVGAVGLGLLLVSMAASLAATWRLFRAGSRHAWVGLIYLQYVINGMLSGSLFTDSSFWAFGLGVIALTATLPLAGQRAR